ncbi:DUF1934 domain-containing protein [Carnobacterium sp. ISL-102]|uniref:DUF1934 domain-containing protein n=1 Tax=Carnobacterium sp. ISL-102 TaxID=2819142 RepID=UPI0020355200|nr:DUF1934 domain-containing protein [Carnobacterium sp. ISL-102]
MVNIGIENYEVKQLDLSKGRAAQIHLETIISQGNETEKHVFDEAGKVVQMNSSYYIRFQETYEAGVIPVTVKIDPSGIVTLTRKGETTTRMRFDKGERFETLYHTPQGEVKIETMTKNMQISYTDEPFSGRVYIEYDLFLGKEKLGDYKLQLLFTI